MAIATATPDLSFLPDSMNWLSIGTEGAIATWVLTLLCCLLITRNTKALRTLFFPILLGWNAVGLNSGLGAVIISGIVFVHATLGNDVLATILVSARDKFGELTNTLSGPSKRTQRRIDARHRAEAKAMSKTFGAHLTPERTYELLDPRHKKRK